MKNKIKKMVVAISKKSKTFRVIVRTLRRKYKNIQYRHIIRKNPIEEKMILFEVYGGKGYTCSPKAIYEKLITMPEFQDYTCIWVFQEPDKHEVKPFKNLKIINTNSLEYQKYFAKSKYLIVNSLMPEYMDKRAEQVYVQCWHGTPLKRLRCDIEVQGSELNTIEEIRKRNDIDAKRFDYFISPSAFASKCFRSAFNLKNLHSQDIIIEEGYPRNDGLFNRSKKDIAALKKKIGIPKNKKVIFYSPTFRDNQHTSGVGYTYELAIDFNEMKNDLGKDYIILFRPHYYIANKIDLSSVKDFVLNVADYDEISDLYLVSDILITDYSSVFFDFANLKKPMLFYMYDLETYQKKLRDFYISLDELPGPIIENQQDLVKCILNAEKDQRKYLKKYQKFNKKYNYLDDGHASERVINIVFGGQK